MTAQDALVKLRECYRNRDMAARSWRTEGGKVVGYICDNIPEELITAAGFFPLRLTGDPFRQPVSVRQYVLPYVVSNTPRQACTDSILDLILTGGYEYVDYLVIPRNKQVVQSLYRELLLAKKNFSDLKLPEVYFLDRTFTPYYEASLYNRDCVIGLKKQLETWAEKSITDSELAQAIAVGNENKRLLSELALRRKALPPEISGTLAMEIIGSSMFMKKIEHNKFLTQLLNEPCKIPSADQLRIFIGGSPLDHTGLYEIIESLDAIVVAEDHCWGNRVFDSPIRTDIDPLDALAERYHEKPACSIRFPIADAVSTNVGRAIDAGAQAAIFYCTKGDRSQVWETPDEIRELKYHGISSLHLKEQDYATSSPDIVGIIKKFIDEQLSCQ